MGHIIPHYPRDKVSTFIMMHADKIMTFPIILKEEWFFPGIPWEMSGKIDMRCDPPMVLAEP